jgi:ribosomal protein L11 methylase PrmA
MLNNPEYHIDYKKLEKKDVAAVDIEELAVEKSNHNYSKNVEMSNIQML